MESSAFYSEGLLPVGNVGETELREKEELRTSVTDGGSEEFGEVY